MPEVSASGHIGYYSDGNDPIGQFQTLLYLPASASPDQLVEPMRDCMDGLSPNARSEPGSASAVMIGALDAALPVSVKMVDRINPTVGWFYRFDMAEDCRLTVFELGALTSESRFDPEAASEWMGVAFPEDWNLHSEMELG